MVRVIAFICVYSKPSLHIVVTPVEALLVKWCRRLIVIQERIFSNFPSFPESIERFSADLQTPPNYNQFCPANLFDTLEVKLSADDLAQQIFSRSQHYYPY